MHFVDCRLGQRTPSVWCQPHLLRIKGIDQFRSIYAFRYSYLLPVMNLEFRHVHNRIFYIFKKKLAKCVCTSVHPHEKVKAFIPIFYSIKVSKKFNQITQRTTHNHQWSGFDRFFSYRKPLYPYLFSRTSMRL